MKTFLGIGAGPIQTGIFASGASLGGFDRIVLADVDKELVTALRKSAAITVNTATVSGIRTDTYRNIEILNPADPADAEALLKAGKEALVVVTALPSTAFYKHLGWLKRAFAETAKQTRYVYAAENSTTAASELETFLGSYENTYFLDTVIGKMSKVFLAKECDLPTLAPGFPRGHLVEEFNTIYTDDAPGVEAVGVVGLYPKKNLVPFEEAKLYGHNAVHFLLALRAAERGRKNMGELAKDHDLLRLALGALKDECGTALCKKFAGVDPFFTRDAFNAYATELVRRMVSPLLNDSIDRVTRDMERKLSWNDRLVGALRLCISQGVPPVRLADGLSAQNEVSPEAMRALWMKSPNYDDMTGEAILSMVVPASSLAS